MVDTAVNFWPKGAMMLDRIIKKDWGLMLPIRTYDSEGSLLSQSCRFVAHSPGMDTKTSIHRHSCDSGVTVVSGQASVEFDQHEVILSAGDSIAINANIWHRLRFTESGTTVVEEYVHSGLAYPIERYEGEGWPDE